MQPSWRCQAIPCTSPSYARAGQPKHGSLDKFAHVSPNDSLLKVHLFRHASVFFSCWEFQMTKPEIEVSRTCNDATFPILDYDPAQKKCVCLRHPCWDDNGVQHKCPGDVPEVAWQWCCSRELWNLSISKQLRTSI